MTQILSFKNVSKEYDGEIVLKGVSFNIREGEFITILGPSGSGKSTVLRLIAGFEQPSSGQIIFNNQDLTKIPAYKREINTIFQHLGLFPHLNVYENIAYGLRIKKKSNLEIEEKIKAVLELVVLKNCEKKFISELSGGEKQRVAIARVLINDSKIVLFDEPFSALDLKLRRKMQTELKKIKNKVTGTTFIFITHDQEEGLMLGDRTIILNEGQVQQISKPEAVYNDPENKWVAQFIGDSNVIENGIFIEDLKVKFDEQEFKCIDKGFGKNETNIDIVIRPEDIDMVPKKKGFFIAKINSVTFKGVHWEFSVSTTHRNFLIHSTDIKRVGASVGIRWNEEDIHVMWKEIDE